MERGRISGDVGFMVWWGLKGFELKALGCNDPQLTVSMQLSAASSRPDL